MELKVYRYLIVAVTLIGLSAFFSPSLLTSASTALAKEEKAEAQAEPTDKACPKCTAAMEEGYVRDYWNSNSYDPSAWSPKGSKQTLFSYGKRIKMVVYRCSSCGYVEYYAR